MTVYSRSNNHWWDTKICDPGRQSDKFKKGWLKYTETVAKVFNLDVDFVRRNAWSYGTSSRSSVPDKHITDGLDFVKLAFDAHAESRHRKSKEEIILQIDIVERFIFYYLLF